MEPKKKPIGIGALYRTALRELPAYRERNARVIQALANPTQATSRALWDNYAIVTSYRAARRFVQRYEIHRQNFNDLFSATLARSIELFPVLARRHAREPIQHVSGTYFPYVLSALKSEARKLKPYHQTKERAPKKVGVIEDHVHGVLEEIPLRKRLMVEAYYLHGLNTTEIGRLMDMTPGSVHTTLWRIRKELRKKMKAIEPRKALRKTIRGRRR